MRLTLEFGLVLIAAALTACSDAQHGCRHGDWCACSGGTDCFQSCDTTDGCRFFCDHMTQCGATCGNTCTFDFHDANENSVDCGDGCQIQCHDSSTCGVRCGASCDYTSYNTDLSEVQAGPNSTLRCITVKSCAVECLGACLVFCMDGVDSCDIHCSDGAPPLSCPNGSLACGSC